MRILTTTLLLTLSLALNSNANDVATSEPILYNDNGSTYAILNVQWKNAWRNDTNHDAVWLFFKFLRLPNGYANISVLQDGHTVTADHGTLPSGITFEIPKDRFGVYLIPKNPFRGDVNVTIKVLLDRSSLRVRDLRGMRLQAYVLEMVYIPQNKFFVGEADQDALRFGSLYKSGADSTFNGVFPITSEDQVISVTPTKDNLFYKAKQYGYEGDQSGEIPASFPKGVYAFYIMKYEHLQGQYADFLNALWDGQSQLRANFGGKEYYQNRGSIKIVNGLYVAENPNAPCNYISWDDSMAYADWAGLRPMTEFEFTKASRGPNQPAKRDFPWGTDSKLKIQRMIAANGSYTMLNGMDEGKLTATTKDIFGASFYWVMDLSGGLWERVISIGHPRGRNFTGSHGDGNLTEYGTATNEDWPIGIEDKGGFGYRGGGFYGTGHDYNEYNPFSPVSFRPYGGWSGGNRQVAYGARFVRTQE